MANPDVRNPAVRDTVVDGRAVHVKDVGDLPHAQWNDAPDLDAAAPYHRRTKPTAIVAERAARERATRGDVESILRRAAEQAGRLLATGAA